MKLSKDAQFLLFAVGWIAVLFLMAAFAKFLTDNRDVQLAIIGGFAFLWFVVTGVYFEITGRR